jgi:hypothetical protein
MRLAALLLLTSWVGAQVHPHVVLTALPGGAPAAQLLEVDVASGAVTTLGRYGSDLLPPLAIVQDPFDRHLLVASDLGTGRSRIVRLERTATGLLEYPMLDVTGRVTALEVTDDSLWIASDGGGGLLRAPRRGGTPALAYGQPHLAAMHAFGPNGSTALVAWTGRPGTTVPNSGTALIDAATGQVLLGPDSFQNPTGLELTGAIDLPTGVPRQFLSFANGTFALFAGMIGPPQPVTPSVPIPPGGAVAMHPAASLSTMPMALGGAPHPFLYEIDFWTGAVGVKAGPLPGNPVDFCSGGPSTAQALLFTSRCGPTALLQGWSGVQQPGSTFALTVQGPGNEWALLALGLRDFPGWPFVLPGGCRVDVAPDATRLHLLDPTGAGSQPIAVPSGPGFLGLLLFGQWLHTGPAGLSVSAAVVHQIGL